MKLFISIPQNGRTDKEVEIEKSQIMGWVFHGADPDKVELIDTYIHEDAPFDGDRSGVWYLGESLKRLASADFVVFATGWSCARGCMIEKMVCEMYDIPHTILEHQEKHGKILNMEESTPAQNIITVAESLKNSIKNSLRPENIPADITPVIPRRGAMHKCAIGCKGIH